MAPTKLSPLQRRRLPFARPVRPVWKRHRDRYVGWVASGLRFPTGPDQRRLYLYWIEYWTRIMTLSDSKTTIGKRYWNDRNDAFELASNFQRCQLVSEQRTNWSNTNAGRSDWRRDIHAYRSCVCVEVLSASESMVGTPPYSAGC